MIKFIKEQEDGSTFTVNKCSDGFYFEIEDNCDFNNIILTDTEIEELIKFINIVKD